MRVSHRLFLAVIPAVLGVLLVAALGYWGEYGRTAPGWLVVIAGLTAVLSLVVTWRNTRYLAARIERLAAALPGGHERPTTALATVRDLARPRIGAAPDEIDSVATEMDRLNLEAASVHRQIAQRERQATERIQEYATLLAECASAVGRQLDEAKLPLHILLENHFGTLNENQEEMIGAARQAAEEASVELKRLEAIASIDRGALSMRRESVQIGELVRGLRPLLAAEASRRGQEVIFDIAPGLPRIAGDRDRLLEAFELLLRHVVTHAEPGEPIRIGVEPVGEGGVSVEARHGPVSMIGPDVSLARRVIAAHGGEVELAPNRTTVSVAPVPTIEPT